MSEIKYVLDVDGIKRILPLNRAAAQYDSGWQKVQLIHVIDGDKLRDPTDQEFINLSDAADKYSTSK